MADRAPRKGFYTSIKVDKEAASSSNASKSTSTVAPTTSYVGYLKKQEQERGKGGTTTFHREVYGGKGSSSQGSYQTESGAMPKASYGKGATSAPYSGVKKTATTATTTTTTVPKSFMKVVSSQVEETIPNELEDSRFDARETAALPRSSAVLGLTKGCNVLSRTHVVAFDILCRTGDGVSVGKSDGVVTIHKTANYKMTLTGFAKSQKDIKVVFYYPETKPEFVALATTHVPAVQDLCSLNGISTTLSLRKDETVQLRVLSEANFTIGEGLRWEITEC